MLEDNLNRRQYDEQAKRFLSFRRVLAFIIKHCVPEFRDVPVDVIAAECLLPSAWTNPQSASSR